MSGTYTCFKCRWFGEPKRAVTDHGDGTATVKLICPECGKELWSYSTTGERVEAQATAQAS